MVARTTDGGTTWESLDSTAAASVQDIVAVDPLSVWAAGAGGMILHTDDGGGPAVGLLTGEPSETPLAVGLTLKDVRD